jgi:hypothetical protein
VSPLLRFGTCVVLVSYRTLANEWADVHPYATQANRHLGL